MNEQEAERLAEPAVKEIVNCISEKRYAALIPSMSTTSFPATYIMTEVVST